MATHTRVTTSAAIIRNNHILLIEHRTREKTYFNLPGGGNKRGETLFDTLRREVLEETGAYLDEIGRLLVVWEYEPQSLDNKYGKNHKVGMIFLCTLRKHSEPHSPKSPDVDQIGMRWVPLEKLTDIELHPAVAHLLIAALKQETCPAAFFEVT